MQPTEIDHVAIAVLDLDAAIRYYRDTVGATLIQRELIESDGVEEALLAVADSYIQLLTPTTTDSPVARFLDRHGEGLHHLGFRVESCADAVKHYQDQGVTMVDLTPRPGSRGTSVAFVSPKSSFGTLIELVEEPHTAHLSHDEVDQDLRN